MSWYPLEGQSQVIDLTLQALNLSQQLVLRNFGPALGLMNKLSEARFEAVGCLDLTNAICDLANARIQVGKGVARGSNAHLADVNVMVQISGEGAVKTAKVTKANDQPEGDIATFRLKPLTFGKDEDGDPIDVALIEAVAGSAETRKSVKQSKMERTALHELNECVADHAEPPPTDPHCPAGTKGVSLDTRRERLRKRSVTPKKGSSERSAFGRIKDGLYRKRAIGIWDDYAWPVPFPGSPPPTAALHPLLPYRVAQRMQRYA